MQVYKHSFYRPAISEIFANQRKMRPNWSMSALADKMGVRPSHLTNVIKERSHFSADQIYAICEELELPEDAAQYLNLLMEWERSTHVGRKEKLRREIQKTRDQKLRIEKNIKAKPLEMTPSDSETYYLDPNVELIHLFLGTKGAPVNTKAIAELWQLDVDYVGGILRFLVSKDLVQLQRGRWLVKPIHQLLPTSSPLCRPQQMLKRLRMLDIIQKKSRNEVYAFNATLTMSEDTKLAIQGKFVDFLKEVEKDVLDSDPDSIYHLQFDLLPLLKGNS